MQLLQHFEHLAPVLAQCVSTWAGEYSLRTIVGEIMREVGAGAGSQESAGSRACATFLTELADRVPEAVMPNISLVLDLLNGEVSLCISGGARIGSAISSSILLLLLIALGLPGSLCLSLSVARPVSL
ncbi:hypothetical protein chiPu_0026004, partial [Chiloscyllium punctatum]|nr:hypothetical protein [Chiloscyllium punctatum]